MSTTKSALIFLLSSLLYVAPAAYSQSSASNAQVSFTFDFPGSFPDHYSLTVNSSGHAVYISGKSDAASKSADSDGDSDSSTVSEAPTRFEFTMSPANRDRIFDLAKRADYFRGQVDLGKANLANTGSKTLAYKDGGRSSHATYNYSTKPAIQELTRLFQNISATLEFGLKLDYLHRYQKLALEDELKQMEQAAKADQLDELQAIVPVVKRILEDSSVMNVSRARAERLLALSGGSVPAK